MLSRQIAGLPVDEAIMQMQFSEKAASKWIKSTLALARDHAELKGIRRQRMIVGTSFLPLLFSVRQGLTSCRTIMGKQGTVWTETDRY